MTITGQEVYQILKHRYPNAEVFVLDNEYELFEGREEVEKLYKGFIRRMAVARLTAWVKNVGDCDKWAWLLKASSIVKSWLAGDKNTKTKGLVCYFINGDKERGHAINNAIWRDGNGSRIREVEPQPKNGIFECTRKERESAWLVII